jgi:hypothetical protein
LYHRPEAPGEYDEKVKIQCGRRWPRRRSKRKTAKHSSIDLSGLTGYTVLSVKKEAGRICATIVRESVLKTFIKEERKEGVPMMQLITQQSPRHVLPIANLPASVCFSPISTAI